MKSKTLHISLLIGAGFVAILAGGGWTMFSGSNEPRSPLGSGMGGAETGGAELGALTLGAYSVQPQSAAPKAGTPVFTVKTYLVSKHTGASEEQNPPALETLDAVPQPDHAYHPHSIIAVASDDSASFSPLFLDAGRSLPPILGGFAGAPNSSAGHGSSAGPNTPTHSGDLSPPSHGGASSGNNGAPSGNTNSDNHGGNSDSPPSGFIPPGPPETYTKTVLPPIGFPVAQDDFNGAPPSLPTQTSGETDSPNSVPTSPVPDNGLTLVLLGISFTGLIGMLRRTRRS